MTEPLANLRGRIADQRRQIEIIDQRLTGLQEARARRFKNLQRLHAQLALSEPAEAPRQNG